MLNKIMIIGFVGKDSTDNEAAIWFPVATTRKWKTKSGEVNERTEWFRVTFFKRFDKEKHPATYVKKGDKIWVEGELQSETYVDKMGEKRFSNNIIGRNIVLLGGKNTDKNIEDEENKDDAIPF
jgi:single-strand DNA-binding protein